MTKPSIVAEDWRGNFNIEEIRFALDRDGIFVVRNLIPASDIARLRATVEEHLEKKGKRFGLGRTQPNAANEVPDLEFIYAYPDVLRLFEAVLGPGNVIFTGHSDIHMNMLSGWHKDSGEAYGGYFKGDYFAAQDCRVYKIALYLQDHEERDGLTVRPGSHHTSSVAHGQAAHVASRAGDAIIFDVRLSHIGQIPDPFEKALMGGSLLLSGGDRRKPDNRIFAMLKDFYWRLRNRRNKLSIFFTYGADNAYTQQFAEANMDRQNRQAGLSAETVRASLARALADQGVRSFQPEH